MNFHTIERILLQLIVPLALSGAVAVTTEHNDAGRSGSNSSEVILNTSNVNAKTFGKVFSRAVDGQIIAQPLYVPNVAIPGKGTHNVIYVCTEHNSVYAYDADDPAASTPLWQINLGPSVASAALSVTEEIIPEIGISSTPVIDLLSRTLYVVAATYESGAVVFHLHALDLASGTSKKNSPALIQGGVTGNGTDSHNGLVSFRPFYQMQRVALLLANGQIYIAFGSHEDQPVFHGWVFAYNAATLQQSSVFCTSPNADSAGVSAAGAGLAADEQGNIYLKTGDGIMDADAGGVDYGASIIKLSSNLTVLDRLSLSRRDQGSGGVALLVGTSLGLTSSANGRVFLFDTTKLGSGSVIQEWQAAAGMSAATLYDNSTLYIWGRGSALRAFSFNGSLFDTQPAAESNATISPTSGNQAAMSISSSGANPGTGILWASYPPSALANDPARPGILRALDASDVSKELWNSEQESSRDSAGAWAKSSAPTVANGKVYLATFSNVLAVYGLLNDPGSKGMLTGVGDSGSVPANLAMEGTLDWVQWIDGEPTRKAGASTQLGTDTSIGGAYSFSAPADTTVRRLVVHLGGSSSGGTLTAHLSDGSAADYIDVNAPVDGPYERNYTLIYRAASGGQILNVDWRKTSGTGTVTASAVALGAAPAAASGLQVRHQFASIAALASTANVHATAGTPQSAPIGTSFSTSLQATVTDSGGAPASGVPVTFTAPGAPKTVSASYFAMALNHPDYGFGHDEGNAGHSFVSTVGGGLGPNGLPVLNSTGLSILHDVNPSTNELQWWSTQSSYVSVLNNSFYTPTVTLPFCSNHMYTNAGVGQTGDDSEAVLTAKLVGNFSLASPGSLGFNFCSNDDGLLYLSGGVFGANGTLIIDNGGIHDVLCIPPNVNAGLLNNVAPGDYTVTVFYDDRQQVGAELDLSMSSSSSTAAQGRFAGATIATALTNTSGIATAPVFTANGQPGSYSVTGAVAGVAAPANFSLTNSLTSPHGSLSGSGNSGASPVNLTAEGTGDWVHWGDGSLTRKSGVAPQLSTYSVVGNGVLRTYSDDTRPMSWTDGTPTAISNGNRNGVYIYGPGQGFSFAAPADTSVRTLIVHVGGWKSAGTLTAHLSDGSAADFVDVTQVANGKFDRNYTLTYAAGSPNQTLTVTWVMNDCGPGNVTFNAAALVNSVTPASVQATGGTPQSATIGTAFGAGLQAKVTDASNNPLSGVTVTFTAPGSGASATFAGSATASAVTNGSGIAVSPALTANSQAGSYVVSASVAGVASPASFNLTNTSVVGSGGALQGSGDSSAALVNLTAEGTSDWEHWGEASLNRKTGVPAQLSSYTAVGAGPVSSYANDPRPMNWSDGNPTLTSTGNQNGVYISGVGQGFSFTAPADTAARSLVVHVGGWFSGGTLTAHLSDGSAPDFVDATTTAAGQYDRNYTIAYHAGTAGQSLTVTWVMTSGTGNVTLSAAALAGASVDPSIVASGGTPQSTAISTAFATALQATVKDSGGNPVSGASVTFTAPASGATATFGGSATANVLTDASGVATAPALTANSQTGGYTVIATVAGAANPANFSLTNTIGSAASIVANGGTPQSAIISTAFGTALQATVRDSGGNLLSGVTVTFTAPASGASITFGGSTTANVITNASGVATAPAFTANSQSGGYTVTAKVTGVASSANFSLTNTAAAGGGTLQGTETSATTAVNLTAEGAIDWIHWGDFANATANRKAGVSPQLSTFTVVGSGTLNTYSNDPRRMSWTDGAPTARSSNNGGGSYISGVGKGYSFTAPADTASRTLVVHVGGYNSGGTLTAQLSDGSAVDYVDGISAWIGGQYDRNYTISYRAAAAGQTLTVKWVMSSGSGNVTLSAAALQGASVNITPTAGTPQSTSHKHGVRDGAASHGEG